MGTQLEWATSTSSSDYETLFVEVILPLPIPKLYTYRVPNDWNDLANVGSRVLVQFGRKKIYTAIVVRVLDTPPEGYEAKLLLDILDETPLLNNIQLEFFDWVAKYYLAHPGDVITAGLPAGLKLSSESKLQLNPDYEIEPDLNSQEETLLLTLEKEESLTYTEAEKSLGLKSINRLVLKLVKRGAILLFEEVKDKYKPKKVKRIRLSSEFNSESAIEQLVSQLEKKQKQLDVLLSYLQLSQVLNKPELNFLGITKKELTEKTSPSSLKTLSSHGIFEEFEQEVSRFVIDAQTEEKKVLNIHQQLAIDEIRSCYETLNTCLLHGITGSGKTEIYIHLIQEYLEKGKQVLYLLPEIALSTQIFSRLKNIFGSALGVYHSKFSDNERVEIYKGIKTGEYQVILGVRSSIFLPFEDLGLIIIDEEHDGSYKQHEPAPRYHARDAALMLGHLHKSKVILGTATPSIETFHLAKTGKYGLVNLHQRHADALLPEVILTPSPFVNKGQSYFSDTFVSMVTETLAKKEQIILFQNRRGYSPYVHCRRCDHIPMCVNCNVSLTYHKFSDELRCHYCGHSQGIPQNCEECGSHEIHQVGFGTEKLEDDIQLYFKDAKIARMDTDTTRSRSRLEKLIDDFKNKRTDILIGTQMVTKGLDFKHVTLVAVFDIDRMLFFPDFRSSERVVQLLTQISGRAGREKKAGRVIIQTNNPKNELIQAVSQHTYLEFYEQEIKHRKQFLYPPYCRLVKIIIKNKDKLLAERTSLYLGRILKEKFEASSIIGPEEPVINKIRNQYIEQIYFKLPRKHEYIEKVNLYLLETVDHVYTKPDYKSSRIILDVDPA